MSTFKNPNDIFNHTGHGQNRCQLHKLPFSLNKITLLMLDATDISALFFSSRDTPEKDNGEWHEQRG